MLSLGFSQRPNTLGVCVFRQLLRHCENDKEKKIGVDTVAQPGIRNDGGERSWGRFLQTFNKNMYF